MKTNKKFPQEASSENLNNIEIFLSKEDNQFYYLDRNRKPIRLVPESLATDKNNQILEIGGEGDELTLKNGSLNGTPVPDSVIPIEQIAQGFKLEDVSDVDPYSGNADKFLKVNASGNDVEWVDAPGPTYQVFSAIMQQNGTNAPTLTILEDTLGISGEILMTRIDPGFYRLSTLTTFPFTTNKTQVFIQNEKWTGTYFAKAVPSLSAENRINFIIYRSDTNANEDDLIVDCSLEIRVYP